MEGVDVGWLLKTWKFIVCQMGSLPHVCRGLNDSHILRACANHVKFSVFAKSVFLGSGYVAFCILDSASKYPYLLLHQVLKHLQVDRLNTYKISRKQPCLVESQVNILPALRSKLDGAPLMSQTLAVQGCHTFAKL